MMKQTAPACPHGSCRNTLSDSYPLLVHLRAVFFANAFPSSMYFLDISRQNKHTLASFKEVYFKNSALKSR